MASDERVITSVLGSGTPPNRPAPGPPSWLLILVLLCTCCESSSLHEGENTRASAFHSRWFFKHLTLALALSISGMSDWEQRQGEGIDFGAAGAPRGMEALSLNWEFFPAH